MENKKDIKKMTLQERFKYMNEQKKIKFNSTNNEYDDMSDFDDVPCEDNQFEPDVVDTNNDFDEDHALDMVMNDMVKDFTEEDIKNLNK